MYNDASAASLAPAHQGRGTSRQRRPRRDLAAGAAAGAAGAAPRGSPRPASGRLDRGPADRSSGAERRQQRAEAGLRPGCPELARLAGPSGVRRELLPDVVAPGTTLGPGPARGMPPTSGWHRIAAWSPAPPTAAPRSWRPVPTRSGDGVTALGTTLTLKLLSAAPVFSPEHGVYSHRLGDRWLVGGASNSGGKALLRFFTAERMAELTPHLEPRPADRPALASPARARRTVPGGRSGDDLRAGAPARRRGRPAAGPARRDRRGGGAGLPVAGPARRADAAERAHRRRRCRQPGLDGDPRRPAAACRCSRRSTWSRPTARRCWREVAREARRPGRARGLFRGDRRRSPSRSRRPAATPRCKADGLLWVKASGLWLADALTRDIFVPVGLGAGAAGHRGGRARSGHRCGGRRAQPGGSAPVDRDHPARPPAAPRRRPHPLRPDDRPGDPAGRRGADRRAAGRAALGLGALLQARPAADPRRRRPGSGARPPTCWYWAITASSSAARQRERGRRRCWPRSSGGVDAPAVRLEPEPAADSRRPAGTRLPRHARGPRAGTRSVAAGPRLRRIALPRPRHLPRAGRRCARPTLRGRGGGPRASCFWLPGHGAFLAADAGVSADELALCLALVLERVPADAALRYLTAADEAELLDWDAEKYRQALARSRPSWPPRWP